MDYIPDTVDLTQEELSKLFGAIYDRDMANLRAQLAEALKSNRG